MPHQILIIDDEEAVRESLELLLTLNGHQVTTAPDGKLGIEALERDRPGLVMTDIIMPGSEGIETILAIKAAAPDVRLIAMSGGARINGRDFLELAAEVGADACLDKPFTPDELFATIERCMAGALPG